MATPKNRRPGPSGTARPRIGGLPRGVEPAPMGARYVARVVDFMVVAVFFLLGAFVGGTSGATGVIAGGIFFLLAAIAYEVTMIARRGATVGKKFAAVKVVRLSDGGLPTVAESAKRYAVIAGPGFVTAGLGSIVVGLSSRFDKSGRRQGWHDKAAGTIVVTDLS